MLLAKPADSRKRFGPWNRALSEDSWFGPRQVEHRRRRARQLAAVDDCATRRADFRRHVLQTARIGAAMEVRARREDGAGLAEHLRGPGRKVGHPDADGGIAAQPG